MEGKGKRSDRDKPSIVEFPSPDNTFLDTETANHQIESDGNEARRRRTRSEVWGMDPTRHSEQLSNPSVNNSVLVTKINHATLVIKVPQAYSDAIHSPEGKYWRDAMDYELAKLEEMNTWSEIDDNDIPDGTQILPGMWVHIVKNLESGERKFRSQWVVRGDQQKMNISLSDTFAPVSRISSLRILLALAAIINLQIFAWDVDSAYLHSKLDHDIYIYFPDGYEKHGKVGKLTKHCMAYLKQLVSGVKIWNQS